MKDPFHESEVAYDVAFKYYTDVSSLSGTAVYSVVQACENALLALWRSTLGPKSRTFQLDHQPAKHIKEIGLYPYYSEGTRIYLDKQIEWKLHEVRFEHTKAYEEYISDAAHGRSKFIIEGTREFINETKAMIKNQEVIRIIKDFKK